jgi:hypothetical protein
MYIYELQWTNLKTFPGKVIKSQYTCVWLGENLFIGQILLFVHTQKKRCAIKPYTKHDYLVYLQLSLSLICFLLV